MRRADKSTRIKMIGTTSISTRSVWRPWDGYLFLSSSLVKVHHSFGRAHDHSLVVGVPERGVLLDLPFADRMPGPDGPRLPMLPIRDAGVKPRHAAGPGWSRGDSNS